MLEAILRQIAAHTGVEGVVLADSQGEPVFAYGNTEVDQLKLLGAYQGVLLSSIERMLEGKDRTVITVGDSGTILTHHLKDGYFISVIVSPDAHFAHLEFEFQDAYASLIKEL